MPRLAAPADDFLFLPPQLPHASSSSANGSSSSSSRFKPSSSSSSPVLVLPESSRSQFGGVGLSSSAAGGGDASFRATRDALLWSLGSSFLSSFVAQPFEAGKVLAQIQYLPRRSFTTLQLEQQQRQQQQQADGGGPADGSGGGGTPEVDELSDDDDAQAYFEDLVAVASKTRVKPDVVRRQTDADGYVVRRGSDGDDVRDEWVMKRGYSGDGPWAMTKRLWNDEGPGAPWKGVSSSSLPGLRLFEAARPGADLNAALAPLAGLALSYLLVQLSTSLPSLISSTLSPMYLTNPSVRVSSCSATPAAPD